MSEVDYLSNTLIPTYPDGLDIEIFRASTILDLNTKPMSVNELEHVTYGIYSNPGRFKTMNFPNIEDLSDLRWTLDYPEDLKFVSEVYKFFEGRELDFNTQDLLDLLAKNPNLKSKIPGNRRNEQLKILKIGNN
jgi:spore coat polysaccharide biosynthesis protein SpsF